MIVKAKQQLAPSVFSPVTISVMCHVERLRALEHMH